MSKKTLVKEEEVEKVIEEAEIAKAEAEGKQLKQLTLLLMRLKMLLML